MGKRTGYCQWGKDGNRFGPQGSATRAELAVMLHRWLSANAPTAPEPGATTLVAYFSCTGSTRAIAQTLAEHLDADLYASLWPSPIPLLSSITATAPAALPGSRTDPASRPALGGDTLNIAGYDRVYRGYPIWFGQAPKIISTFLERYDMAGKTIIPFCTSGSRAIGSSANALHGLALGANWMEGRRFDRGIAGATITDWADKLFLETTNPGTGSGSNPGSGSTPKPTPTPDPEDDITMPTLTIQVGSNTFTATLEDNNTTRSFVARLPMTVTMGERNGNEKYYYLPNGLPTNSQRPGTRQTGDLMLYGSECLVLFYERFSSGYSYTRMGRIDDPFGLATVLGRGSAEVSFEVR